jgi:hypothetical protein
MTYIDIDGTLTEKQQRWATPIPSRIQRVQDMIAAGEDVIIWSGTERYAREWCKKNGLTGKYAPKHILGKPNYMVDNQGPFTDGSKVVRFRGIMGRRRKIITPECWMEQSKDVERLD